MGSANNAPRKLKPGTIGHQRLLGPKAIDGIIKSTGLSLVTAVDPERFAFCLNTLVDMSISNAMFARFTKREFKKLSKAFDCLDSYSKTAFEFRERNPSPPMVPGSWFDDTKDWFEDMKKAFEDQAQGGRPPNKWGRKFYPEALGLFNAAFDEEPMSTVNESDREKSGPAARFLTAVIGEVRDAQLEIGFDDQYRQGQDKLLTWSLPGASALQNKIAEAKRRKRTHRKNDGAEHEELVWKTYNLFYQTMLKKR